MVINFLDPEFSLQDILEQFKSFNNDNITTIYKSGIKSLNGLSGMTLSSYVMHTQPIGKSIYTNSSETEFKEYIESYRQEWQEFGKFIICVKEAYIDLGSLIN
jgi:hypothetical protein